MARPPFNPNLIRAPEKKARPTDRGPLSVSQVTALVKNVLESGLPATLHVLGEISNFKRHSSGHLYLTLKDRSSELSCVMWRSAAASLKFAPTDGMAVIATGRVEVFERAGRYQLYIRKLEPRGIGSLELAFRQLCEKLESEGLFDERHKKTLPAYPQRIVLVTSPTGAAVADMLRTIERRFPCVDILVYPVRVQGPGAAAEIARAIRRVNARCSSLGGIDLMIVGRGGGSIEDLWAFNEEPVARAIHTSRIPIISAVGHEVDVTVADLVADVRAATPTAAAELAVPVLDEVMTNLSAAAARLGRTMRARAEFLASRLRGVFLRSPFREPLAVVHRREQRVDELGNRLQRALSGCVHGQRRRLDRLEPVIQRIAPHTHMLRRAVKLREAEHRLRWVVSRRLGDAERSVSRHMGRLDRVAPGILLAHLSDRVDHAARVLAAGMRHRLSLYDEQVRRPEERLCAMSYKSVLGRGFSITRIKKGSRVVRSLSQLNDRQRLVTEVADGEFESEVVNLNQRELFE